MPNFNLDNYIPVNERLTLFYKDFPNGRVLTSIIEHDRETGFILIRAAVYRAQDDAEPAATGHAYESQGSSYVNKTSYVENCETSACGRALALLGYEITKGIASREEMAKVGRHEQQQAKPNAPAVPTLANELPLRTRIVNAQNAIKKLGGEVINFDFTEKTDDEMKTELSELSAQYKQLQISKGNK